MLVRGGGKGVLGTGEVMIGSTGTNRIDILQFDRNVKNCFVILSGVGASRNEAPTQSKDPYKLDSCATENPQMKRPQLIGVLRLGR